MTKESLSAGFYHSSIWQRNYPKIQIRTIEEMLGGVGFDLPPHHSMYQPAERVSRDEAKQGRLA